MHKENTSLKSIIERVERLEEDRKGLVDDIREVFDEAKGNGFDQKIIKKLIRLRRMNAAERREAAALLAAYAEGIGMSQEQLSLF